MPGHRVFAMSPAPDPLIRITANAPRPAGVALATIVSAPPARSDDNPLEEAVAIRVGLHSRIVGKGEMDLSSRRWCQRAECHRRAASQGFISRLFGALLKLMGPAFLEAVAIEVYREVARQSAAEDPVGEILEGVQSSAAGRRQETEVGTLELAIEGLVLYREPRGNVERSGAKGLR
jgi:hypothetical protein